MLTNIYSLAGSQEVFEDFPSVSDLLFPYWNMKKNSKFKEDKYIMYTYEEAAFYRLVEEALVEHEGLPVPCRDHCLLKN